MASLEEDERNAA